MREEGSSGGIRVATLRATENGLGKRTRSMAELSQCGCRLLLQPSSSPPDFAGQLIKVVDEGFEL